MSDPRTDELSSRLQTMAHDADGITLADSADVRRRGTQRRRTAIAASGVAAVMVVAVGASLAAGVLDRPAAAPPATTVSPSPSTSPTVHSSPPATAVLADHPFLRPQDLAPIGPYRTFAQVPGDGSPRLDCLSSPRSWGATDVRSQAYGSDLDATFVETVLQFSDVSSAIDAAARPLTEFATCPEGDPADVTVSDRDRTLSVAHGSYLISRLFTPTAPGDLAYKEVAVVRESNVVVVLEWLSMGTPDGEGGWAWTSEQVQTALDRALATP